MPRPTCRRLVRAAVPAILGCLALTSCAQAERWVMGPECRVVTASGTVVVEGAVEEVAPLVADAVSRSSAPGDSSAASRAEASPAQTAALKRALSSGAHATCRASRGQWPEQVKAPPRGLTPRAEALRSEVRSVFGSVPAGGFSPEKVLAGRSPDGEHTQGRAIDFFFRPYTSPRQAERGWLLANWLVVHAERLAVQTVIYRDRIWTMRRSAEGWRPYRFYGSDKDNPINRHLDHVHVDVH